MSINDVSGLIQRHRHEGIYIAKRGNAASDHLKKLVEMRRELAAVWERSNLSREQLLAHLQQWCQSAEASGIRALQDLALRVRSYAA